MSDRDFHIDNARIRELGLLDEARRQPKPVPELRRYGRVEATRINQELNFNQFVAIEA